MFSQAPNESPFPSDLTAELQLSREYANVTTTPSLGIQYPRPDTAQTIFKYLVWKAEKKCVRKYSQRSVD